MSTCCPKNGNSPNKSKRIREKEMCVRGERRPSSGQISPAKQVVVCVLEELVPTSEGFEKQEEA